MRLVRLRMLVRRRQGVVLVVRWRAGRRCGPPRLLQHLQQRLLLGLQLRRVLGLQLRRVLLLLLPQMPCCLLLCQLMRNQAGRPVLHLHTRVWHAWRTHAAGTPRNKLHPRWQPRPRAQGVRGEGHSGHPTRQHAMERPRLLAHPRRQAHAARQAVVRPAGQLWRPQARELRGQLAVGWEAWYQRPRAAEGGSVGLGGRCATGPGALSLLIQALQAGGRRMQQQQQGGVRERGVVKS